MELFESIEVKKIDKEPNSPVDRILEELDPEQKKAVMHEEGPLLIVAGAGTGKTTVITRRIAWLISSKKAKPDEILALTFTDKAANEMETRVDQLVPYGYTDVWISTFHSFGDRLLRDYSLELGLTSDFRVLTVPEQIIFLRDHLFELPMNYYRPLGDPTKHLSALTKLISRCKDEDITPEEYLKHAAVLKDKVDSEPDNRELKDNAERQMEIALIYQKYQELMGKYGMADFGDQVNLALKLFREKPSILKRFQKRFRYILVDEFQDTNYAQFELVKLITQEHKNITVVGDDDQSIYKFRGAAISNILGFMDTYPDAQQVVITRNYRSTQPILDSAYRLIKFNNPDRLETKNKINKKLISQRGKGEFVRHLHYDTLFTESDTVARMIKEKVDSGEYLYRDFAILVRSNADADPFLRSLNLLNIPWTFSGNQGLYSREEIRLLISFLRSISKLHDSLSLYYLCVSEIYRINAMDLTTCMNYASRKNQTLHYVFKHLPEISELEHISDESKASIKKVMEDIEFYIQLSTKLPTGQVLYEFLNRSGYIKRLTAHPNLTNEEKVKNIAKFFDNVRHIGQVLTHDTVNQFVDYLDTLINAGDDPAVAEADPDMDAVNVLTIHKAKGLEFPVVFMVSLVSDKFPTRRRSEPIPLPDELIKDKLPEGDFHIQEERRLFYVGMTRAKDELYLTTALDYGGKRTRKISQFVREAMDIPKADVDAIKTSAEVSIKRQAPPPEMNIENLKEIPETDVIHLNPHQIDDYLTCPLKYKYVHILRVPILQHHLVVYGSALHQAIQYYHQRKKEQLPVSAEDLIKIFESAWVNEGFLTREHEEQRLESGRETLRRFFEEQEKSGTVPTYVEKEFSFTLDNTAIRGRWDRVDIMKSSEFSVQDSELEKENGEVIIIDFKSSQVDDQKSADKRAKESLQLDIYALAYQRIHGKIPERLELHFLESGLIGITEKKNKDLENTIEEIRKVAKGIRVRDYTPTPGYMVCQYCAYNQICPSTAFKSE